MAKQKNKTKPTQKEIDEHLEWLLAIDFLKCEPH